MSLYRNCPKPSGGHKPGDRCIPAPSGSVKDSTPQGPIRKRPRHTCKTPLWVHTKGEIPFSRFGIESLVARPSKRPVNHTRVDIIIPHYGPPAIKKVVHELLARQQGANVLVSVYDDVPHVGVGDGVANEID